MADHFELLREAVIDHLQRLKADGVRYLAVSPDVLANLTKPVSRAVLARPETPRPLSISSVPPVPFKSDAGLSHAQPPTHPVVSILPDPQPASGIEETAAGSTGEKATATGNSLPATEAPPSLAPAAREEAMAQLRVRAMACQKCPRLASTRRSVVFGVGDMHSPLMFVGEAPGAEEDARGEPFVGAAGQLLTKIIRTMGFSRETVYIANVLKCRPDTPGQTSGNRKPTSDEMKTCLPYLLEQIDLIRPRVIVALGVTAVEGLLGLSVPMGKLRGNFQTLRGIPVMPTFHPSYLLHNEALTEKRKVWEDMLKVLAKLDRPITEKQRGYFLRSA